MRARRNRVLVVVCLALCGLCGCATFRAGQLERARSWPPQARASKRSINVLFSGRARVNGRPQEANDRFLRMWRNATLRAYRDSGLFSQVSAAVGESDLRAEVKMLDDGKVSQALAFVSGLTLLVVPWKATDQLTVETTLRDREGKALGSYIKRETVTTWGQILLTLAMPFAFPGSVVRRTIYDLNRATIDQACRDGTL